MSSEDHLQIPDNVDGDTASFEVLRVWIARKRLNISLRTGVWNDSAAWGIMLADLARHITEAHFSDDELGRTHALRRIMAAFAAELASTSTDKAN